MKFLQSFSAFCRIRSEGAYSFGKALHAVARSFGQAESDAVGTFCWPIKALDFTQRVTG